MKTILKKVSSAVMALAVMTLATVFDLPITVTVAAAGGCDGTSHSTAWAGGPFTANGSYYLNDDVSLASQIEIDNGVDVTLCLNGHTVTAGSNSRIFTVKNGSLTICDCTENGKITGGALSGSSDDDVNYGGAVYVNKEGAFTMNGGTISGNSAKEGGGVYNSGTFVMNGGTISGNSSHEGGGVYVRQASEKFEMKGGTISGNTAEHEGGGVYVCSALDNEACGVFEMSGGTISGNTVNNNNQNDNGGGGVYTAGMFTMSGGMISDNTASSCFGGGVCISGAGEFTMSSGTISGNTARYGGGLYVSNGIFNMTGGTIGGIDGANTASNSGGGICLSGGTVKLDGYVDITLNEKNGGSESNIYLVTGKTVTIGSNFSTENKIGVHTQEKLECAYYVDAAIFDTGVEAEDISESFKADIDGQVIVYEDSKIQLFIEHNYGDWTITQAPTLTAAGTATRICKNNREHVETIELPQLSDTTVWTKEEKPDKDVYTSEYGTVETPSEGGNIGYLVVSGDNSTDDIGEPDITNITDITENTDDNAGSTDNSDGNDDGLGGNTFDNPSTGIAIAYVPLAAAMTALTAAVKRKKK